MEAENSGVHCEGKKYETIRKESKSGVGGSESCFTSVIKHGWIRQLNSVELQLIDLGREQKKTKKEFYLDFFLAEHKCLSSMLAAVIQLRDA